MEKLCEEIAKKRHCQQEFVYGYDHNLADILAEGGCEWALFRDVLVGLEKFSEENYETVILSTCNLGLQRDRYLTFNTQSMTAVISEGLVTERQLSSHRGCPRGGLFMKFCFWFLT